MALIKADRVRESSTTTGAGAFTLSGAEATFRTFSSVCATGDTVYYTIAHRTANEWETGLGTYSSANTLTRTTVHASSNSGAAVNFSAGTKEVFLALTARHLDRIQDNGQSTAIGSKTSVVAVNDSATLPDLDLQFADLKTLTAKYGPTPSYSRASTGTYFNASGVLTSAAVNEPRFDHVYSGGQWISRGLLLEEQRTNGGLYSEDFTNAYWTKYSCSISGNQATAPDGTSTADKLIEDTSANEKATYISSFNMNGPVTQSCFMKAGERSVGVLQLYEGTGAFRRFTVLYDLSNGTIATTRSVNGGTGTYGIENVGSGWYRCWVSWTVTLSNGTPHIGLSNSASPSTWSASGFPQYTGNGTSGIYIWGSQIETGSWASSYIGTTSSSVTRSADVCQITGSAFTNLWNATEGSYAIDYDLLSTAPDQPLVYVNNGTVNESHRYYASTSPSGGPAFYSRSASVTDGVIVLSVPVVSSGKAAIATKLNDLAGSINSLSVVTDSSVAFPTGLTSFNIGVDHVSTRMNGRIARLRYFRSRLDNAQLVNLSGGINSLAFKTVTGSGSVTVANEYSNINISVPSPLPITNGGTNATTQLAAVTNLVGNPPNDGGQYTLASKKTSGTPTFYWVDSTGYAPTVDLLFAADKSLTAYKGPTPSFSRASTGSYFDSTGVLRYAVLNTLFYSEQFDNGYWVKSGISVSANATVAPDGKSTADKVLENTSSGIKYGTASGGFSVVSGTTYTFSVYAKDSGRFLGFATNSTGFPNAIGAVFNLSSGTISSIQANTTASIQNVGDGWYRCIITGTANATTTTNINFGVSNDVNQIYPSYTGNGSNGYFLWGIQMETGSTANSYVQTAASANSAPRFNHTFNGTSWVSRGLLVEEQRTNLLTYSNTFSNGSWTKVRGAVSQDVVGPDGATSGWTATCNETGGGFYGDSTPSSGASASGTYTISVFAKKGNNGYFILQISDGANYTRIFFDLNLIAVSSPVTSGTYSSTSGSMVNCGNGWYRCSLTTTKGSSTGATGSIFFTCDSASSANCTSGQFNYFYNAQLEFGAFATSSIVTTSAQVTRSADVCQITGSDFSGFWNGTEGSVVLEYDRLAAITSSFSGGYPRYLTVDDGTLNNRMGLLGYTGSPANEAFYAVTGGSSQGDTLIGASSAGGIPQKIGFAYKLNDAAASLNGASVVADTTFAVPTVTKLQIGYYDQATTSPINGHIARLRYYPVRLPNATLQTLST